MLDIIPSHDIQYQFPICLTNHSFVSLEDARSTVYEGEEKR